VLKVWVKPRTWQRGDHSERRFVGDKGFIVTAKQVDPLFTIDLRDPTAPKRIGELKVPGFSSYIHPIDENTLLTIGVYLPEPDAKAKSTEQRSMKLSLYDVSDFANPKEKFTQLVGTIHGYSEATWEHKAFNYFSRKKLLAIPFTDYVSVSGETTGIPSKAI